jgi:hypothetical protein
MGAELLVQVPQVRHDGVGREAELFGELPRREVGWQVAQHQFSLWVSG